jgi:protein-disulfide isomerase
MPQSPTPALGLEGIGGAETILSIVSFIMRTICLSALAAVALAGASAPSKVDKAKIEAYLRYVFPPNTNVVLDDPAPSSTPGIQQIMAHLSLGTEKLDRAYYVTPDGEHLLNGSIWDLNKSPFADTLDKLPTGGYSMGPANAKVTIVLFSDFECPYCKQFATTVRQHLAQKYPNDVRVIFKDFPLPASMHPWAHSAAEAGRCLGEQKPEAFWAFHDWIFEHQDEVNTGNLREKTLAFAKTQHLDDARAASCIDTHATAAAVDESLKIAHALQVELTPTLFINGRMQSGAMPWDRLDAMIQRDLHSPFAPKN